MFDLGQETRRRRIGLTPMIDVVFLLLVFFMLAARFGTTEAIPLTLAGGGSTDYSGPPRLVTVLPEGVQLNGVASDTLTEDLAPLMTAPEDVIILRASNGSSVQRLLDEMTRLRAAGLTNLVVLE